MLNNENLWEISRNIAKQLIEYKAKEEKSSTKRKTAVETLLASTRRKIFLENLISVMNDGDSNFEEIGKIVHFMPEDNFPYFSTLIRFQYAYLIKIK